MYLKSLELSGFKSFARKASLQFESNITGIVGPNGSGKSNIAEAFRFVLGEQSIKSLRGKRGEDMIWNGGGEGSGASAGASRANRASVKVVFDNSQKLFPTIDFSEVSLERIVHRDNINEYLLNGSQVRLKDIVELLAGAHIGATGHHIISQGEADRILSASIRERREMIEDALGLKIYQWKKLESLRKLERTDENMKQVESLRREIAPHLRFLKKQVEKVEKAEELRKELIIHYKEYFAAENVYIIFEKERLTNALREPEKELGELERQLEKAKKILTDSKNKDEKSDKVIAIEEKLKITRNERDCITRELGRIEGEINASRRAIQKEELRIRNEELKMVRLKDVEDVVGSIEALRNIEDVRKLFIEVISTLRSFIAKHRSIADSAMIADAEKEIASLGKEKSQFEKELKAAFDQEERFLREYNDLKSAIEKEKDSNREAEREVFKIIGRQNELRHIVADLKSKMSAVLHDEENFKRELGEAGTIVGREATEFGKSNSAIVGQSEATVDELKRGNLGQEGDTSNINGTPKKREEQEERRRKIEKNKVRLEDAGGSGGKEVMKEYRETEDRDIFLAKELLDLEKAKSELEKLIADLDMKLDIEFKNGILKINLEFQKFFALMFGGGKAELTVVREMRRKRKSDVDDLNEALVGGGEPEIRSQEFGNSGGERGRGFRTAGSETQTSNSEQIISDYYDGPEGLEVSVSLPRKKVKGLMMLSGGERALTSIALLFAISQVNPPPFIILDETDAALDEANSRKYGDMIENLSKRSQLILITHNRETMSRAGVLYGITMGSDGASKLLSIAFEEAVTVAK